MTRRVLVAGVGNIFLGDDGFGTAVAQRLAIARLPEGARVEDYGIRGVHLAYELLDGYDTLILVDAMAHGRAPGTVSLVEPDLDDEALDRAPAVYAARSPLVDSHGLDPAAVLAMLRTLGGRIERVLIVACEPKDVSEHIGLSEPVAAAVAPAAARVLEILERECASADAGPVASSKEG